MISKLETTVCLETVRSVRRSIRTLCKWPVAIVRGAPERQNILVYDIHSQLKRTCIHQSALPDSIHVKQGLIRQGEFEGWPANIRRRRHK